jgi:general secretion pathway protein D
MKKIIFVIFSVLSIGSASGQRPVLNEMKLKDLVAIVSKLTGKVYHVHKDFRGQTYSTENFKITKENADRYFSKVLLKSGYTRIPTGKNVYDIINARDIRYDSAPNYELNDKIPDNYDYIMASYKAKFINTTEIVRGFRPFIGRYGRMIDLKAEGIILIQDSADNVKKLKKLLVKIDVKREEKTPSAQTHSKSESSKVIDKLQYDVNKLTFEVKSLFKKVYRLEGKALVKKKTLKK